MKPNERIQTYAEFWPFYLSEHARPLNRRLHFVGTSLALATMAFGVAIGCAWLGLAALILGYAFAWVGHFVVEKNRPATFRYPLWSFVSDFRLWALMLSRRPLQPASQPEPSKRETP